MTGLSPVVTGSHTDHERLYGRGSHARLSALHVVAALVVVVGLLATAMRPLSPHLGAVGDPAQWFDAAYLAHAAEYREPRYLVAALGLALRIAVPCLVAFTAGGRRLVGAVVDKMGGRPVAAPAAVVLLVVVATDLLVFPLQFWVGYVHDGAFGFRTQGLAGWLVDWVRFTTPSWLLVAVLSTSGWWLLRRAPRAWPAIAGLASSALLVVLVAAAPLVLEPLQFDTEPLADAAVLDAVQAVVDRSGERVDEVVVADASRRSTRQNAYVSGLGSTRRIVLYDNLVEGQRPAVVAQVVAHELAHHRNGDLGRGTLLGAAGLVVGAYALYAVMRWRVRHRRQERIDDPKAAGVVLAVAVLLIVASHPVQNAVSRQYEAAADFGALEMTQDPDTYLEQRLAMTQANLADPHPPRWVRLLWSSHPSAVERIEMGQGGSLEWRGPVRP